MQDDPEANESGQEDDGVFTILCILGYLLLPFAKRLARREFDASSSRGSRKVRKGIIIDYRGSITSIVDYMAV